MITRLRIKGRILFMNNAVLISLLLSTTVMFLICINFFILVYELFWRNSVRNVLSSYIFLGDAFVALMILGLSSMVCCQVRLGTDRYFLRQSQKKGATATDLFYYFRPRRAFEAMAFCVKYRLLKTVWLVVALFPSVICLAILVYICERGVSSLVALVLSFGDAAFFLSGICFYRNVTASFFLAKYHFIAGDCLSFRQMICVSEESMRKRKSILLRLRLSFSGWFLLCFLLLPIGYVWGYYNQTLAAAADEFINSEHQSSLSAIYKTKKI